MFHQVRLLPYDSPLLRFLWRNVRRDDTADVYEWKFLPFGATSSPCCATFAIRKCVQTLPVVCQDVKSSVLCSFYVDNCCQSFQSPHEAKELLVKLRSSINKRGFEIRRWAMYL